MSDEKRIKVVQSDSKALHLWTRVLVLLIAAGAAVLSFDALTLLATTSGIRVEFAWIWAVVVDGFILVATLAAFALRDRSRIVKGYAWVTLGVFVVLSVLGNAWHAAIEKTEIVLPLWVAVIVTAIPPVALFLAIHLLIIMISPSKEDKLEHVRDVERRERVYRLQRRELERVEDLAAINEVREEAGLEPLAVLPGTRARAAAVPAVNVPAVVKAGVKKKVTPSVKPVTGVKNAVTKTVPAVAPAPSTVVENVTVGVDTVIANTDTVNASTDVTDPVEAVTVAVEPVVASVTQVEDVPEVALLTEEEVVEKLQFLADDDRPLPSGKTVAGWLGKSERTGQVFVRKFKETLN
jgi:hypothetical protein